MIVDPHISAELEGVERKLAQLRESAKANEEVLAKLLSEDNVAARIAAEERVADLEERLALANAAVEELTRRNRGQGKMLRSIRKALHGEGRNPLEAHAEAIFTALQHAAPDHHLVTREPTDQGEKSVLSETDLRFIYACLHAAEEKLSRMGCNDWSIEDPDDRTLWFMQRVENFCAEDDKGHERQQIKPDEHSVAWGPANFLVPIYLKKLMEQVYGKELFQGAEELVLR